MIFNRLLPFAIVLARLRGLLITGWILAGISVLPQAASAQLPQTKSQGVTGAWTLCASADFVPVRKGAPPHTRSGGVTISGWTTSMANVCTEVVFQANGTGYAGLTGAKKHFFRWQQHAGILTVTYLKPAAAKATRLEGSKYKINFGVLPAHGDNPALTELALSTKFEKLFLWRAKRAN